MLLSVPFALVGGVWLVYLLGYNLSVAVRVGFIALAGVAAETGVVMIVYLDEVYDRRLADGTMTTTRDLYDAIIEGAVMRVRPKMMTVTAIIAGLLPIMWSHGSGTDVMKRIAAPMVGGMVTSTILTGKRHALLGSSCLSILGDRWVSDDTEGAMASRSSQPHFLTSLICHPSLFSAASR